MGRAGETEGIESVDTEWIVARTERSLSAGAGARAELGARTERAKLEAARGLDVLADAIASRAGSR